MKGKWVGADDVGVYTDARGNRWGCAAKIEPVVELTASQDTRWHASLLDASNEYGAPAGHDIVASTSRDDLLVAVDDWVDRWQGDHATAPEKSGTASGLWLLLLLGLLVLSDKNHR